MWRASRVPAWLAERMTKLGTAIVEAVLLEHGPSELLTRASSPASLARCLPFQRHGRAWRLCLRF